MGYDHGVTGYSAGNCLLIVQSAGDRSPVAHPASSSTGPRVSLALGGGRRRNPGMGARQREPPLARGGRPDEETRLFADGAEHGSVAPIAV